MEHKLIATLRNWLMAANTRTEAQLRGLATLALIAQKTCQAKSALNQAQTALDRAMQAEATALTTCETAMLNLIALQDRADQARRAGHETIARQTARALATADLTLATLRDTARDRAAEVLVHQDNVRAAAYTLHTLREAAIAARALRPEHLDHQRITATLEAC
ncbi:MAG: hypothetical protein ACRC6I_06700 [Paracoccaceae bacterium]